MTRRRFLHAAIVTTVGAISGCVDDPSVEFDPDDDSAGSNSDPPEADGVPTDEEVQPYERAIHERVNDVRLEHDLDALGFNEEIAGVARRHSVDMAERDYFGHVSPDGERPRDRLEEFFTGYCRMIGENVASVSGLPDDSPEAVAERVVAGWMESEGHRENLLREAYDEQGIGVVIDDGRILATQNFCGTAD